MNFDFQKFVKEIHKDFQSVLSLEQIRNLLDLDEEYNKDTPVSTGKRLIIDRIFFLGRKATKDEHEYSNREINFSHSFSSGVNILIADNLKGKSSIFKIIKYALTGSNSLKPDIRKWINHIILNFRLSDKKFTIYVNLEGRLKGRLIADFVESMDDIQEANDHIIFEVNSEKEFQAQIQEFFFNQFAYYSLKWTQKSSQKDSDDLIEAGSSWKTYFKSILLESKDSGTLMYGDQGNKAFQMLLGLRLTYPINRLSVKKDKITYEKTREQSLVKRQAESQNQKKDKLIQRLSEINAELQAISRQGSSHIDLTKLQEDYSQLLNLIQKENEKRLIVQNETMKYNQKLIDIRRETDQTGTELSRIRKEVNKTQKNMIDLEEYLEIGIFFSNLDIKHCPSCDHEVSEQKKKKEVEEHKCALCNETISQEVSEDEKLSYTEKLERLKLEGKRYLQEEALLKTKIADLDRRHQGVTDKLASIERVNVEMDNTESLKNDLSRISRQIEVEKEKLQPITARREELIAERAIVEYQIRNYDSLAENETNYETKINVLDAAIENLKKQRYELGFGVLDRLAELILSEINEFGLTSITEIKITANFDIQYKQNGEFISFDDIAEGEQLRAKIAFYLSLIQLDIEYNFGRHPRLLIIDSPGKEEADSKYLEGLSSVLKSIEARFGTELQILIGTAERSLTNVVDHELIIPGDTYVF